MTLPMALFWLCSNGVTYCLAFRFLLQATGVQHSPHRLLWMAVNSSITLLILRYQIPGGFFLAVGFALLFAKLACHLSWPVLLPPLAVLFTLYSFLEGLTTLAMAWAAGFLPSPTWGNLFQCALCLLGNAALCYALRISQRFFLPGQPPSPAALLLPCAWMLLTLRGALGLDSRQFEPRLGTLALEGLLFLALATVGGIAVLFLLLRLFGRFTLLHRQLQGQQLCLEEAQAQAGRYASFQHDVDNHLLVLSSLLQEKNYPTAQRYAAKLRRSSPVPQAIPATGYAALDALLREKLAQAEDWGIRHHCKLSIPPTCQLDELALCALFANLLDNAIHACQGLAPEARWLSLDSSTRGTLLFIQAANATASGAPFREGTGLQNVRRIAAQYQGSVQIEQAAGRFRVCVLLCAPPG